MKLYLVFIILFLCSYVIFFNSHYIHPTSPDEDALFKEYAWDALSCPDCGGVLPVLYNIYKTNCLKCGIVFELNELLEVFPDQKTKILCS